jgi:preprotein translocase subunit SecD
MTPEYLDVLVKVLAGMTAPVIGFLTWYVNNQRKDAKERRDLERESTEITRQLTSATTDAIRQQVEISREQVKALEHLTAEVRQGTDAIKIMVAKIETRDQAAGKAR